MNEINNRMIRTEFLPMPEEAQREFEEFEKVFGKKKVKEDSLVRDFATGMISGAIAVPSIINAAHGRVRTVQVFNDGPSRLLVKHRHGNNPKSRSDDPGFFTYMIGAALTSLGVLLSGTPAGPILIGVGAGLLGTGVSIAGEAKAEESRNRNRRK